MLKILITSLSVTDRPDLMLVNRKLSASKTSAEKGKKGATGSETGSTENIYLEGDDENDMNKHGSISGLDDDDEDVIMDPTQVALPTMMMAGTVWGEVLRADLSKNKVDVETNNLRRISLYNFIYFL